jgi:hypothetical protein
MPNWCSNTLKVHSTNVEKLKEFKTWVIVNSKADSEPIFTFEKIHPVPLVLLDTQPFASGSENSDELIEKYGASDWYTWRVTNWGTKWDAADSNIIADDEQNLIVWFDTAWSPPIAWVKWVAAQWPELSFSLLFEEPGCDFCGIYNVEGIEESIVEGQYEYYDEDGNEVYYSQPTETDSGSWRNKETDEIVGNEDFWPEPYNPFAEHF